MVEADAIDAEVDALCARAAENAPLTTRATREAIRRSVFRNTPELDDLIELVYGSNDFRRGVQNFLARNKALPEWSGD
jgi:enoyl-CoA hydratase/carnithine racemase